MPAPTPPTATSRRADLTPRERDILAMYAIGLTARQVAARLSISPRTVEGYIQRIRAKFGAASRAQLVRAAVDSHLIDTYSEVGASVAESAATVPRGPSLTERERRVIALVRQGLSNRNIAHALAVSPHTVNYYLRVIFQKLGVNSRVQLALTSSQPDQSVGRLSARTVQ